MRYGILGKRRIKPRPRALAFCPVCNGHLRAKCGQILRWHWAHVEKDCDPWAEPESDWHLEWKSNFPEEWQEYTIQNHRADVRTSKSLFIEFQKSAISPAEIQEREEFYAGRGGLEWVLDASSFDLKPYSHGLPWLRFSAPMPRYPYVESFSGFPSIGPTWQTYSRSLTESDSQIGALIDRLAKDNQDLRRRADDYCRRQQDSIVKYMDDLKAWKLARQKHNEKYGTDQWYRWYGPRKSWLHSTQQKLFDFGNGQLGSVAQIKDTSDYGVCVQIKRMIGKDEYIRIQLQS